MLSTPHSRSPLATAQEQALQQAAEASQRWAQLAFFYWRRQDLVALKRMESNCPDTDPDFRALLALALPSPKSPTILRDIAPLSTPWVLFYVGRYWLQQQELSIALTCAKRCAQITPHYTPLLPLILRYAQRNGAERVAQSLRARMRSQSAVQDDLVDFVKGTDLQVKDTNSARHHTDATSIGFYVPVYNAMDTLPAVLDALLLQAYPLDELLVVDDGSTDDATAIAAKYPARIIRHDLNRGLAAARNTAFRNMSSTYVASCDSDAVLAPDYLIYAELELQSAMGSPAAVGGRMTERHTNTLADSWRASHMSQDSGHFRKCSGPGSSDPTYLPGCNTMINREQAQAIDGYDERHVAVGEDGDFSRRLHATGAYIVTTPLARCEHLRRDTPLSALRTRWNYEEEGHAAYNGFTGLGNLIRLFQEHLSTAQNMVKRDLENSQPEHVLMDILYVYVLYFRSIDHGSKAGSPSIGQVHWFQQALMRSTLRDTNRETKMLRGWRNRSVAPLLFPPDTPLEVPPTYYEHLFQEAMLRLEDWIVTTIAPLKDAVFNAIR